MAPAAYVTEDGLVGHQRKDKPLALLRMDPHCRGIPGGGAGRGDGWEGNTLKEEGEGNVIGGLCSGKGIIFEM